MLLNTVVTVKTIRSRSGSKVLVHTHKLFPVIKDLPEGSRRLPGDHLIVYEPKGEPKDSGYSKLPHIPGAKFSAKVSVRDDSGAVLYESHISSIETPFRPGYKAFEDVDKSVRVVYKEGECGVWRLHAVSIPATKVLGRCHRTCGKVVRKSVL